MMGTALASFLVLATLGVFAWVGFTARRTEGDLDDYLVARNSQSGPVLGMSFLASGMGAWILFAPPEVGAGVGLLGVLGYALGAAGPILAFSMLGDRIRRVVPHGQSITGFVKARFGGGFFIYVAFISLAYMLFFVTAELTAIGGVAEIVSGLDGRIVIIAVAVVTLAYTAYGGLRASLRTDGWQGWLIVGLLTLGFVVFLVDVPSAGKAISESGLLGVDRLGVEVALTLVIAVVAANLFHQGYWQRVWAARDLVSLRRGAGIGASLTVPVVFLVGLLGILAAGSGVGLDVSPVPFFALLGSLPEWMIAVVLVLALSLVASSVDTLENAIASLVVVERRAASMSLARVLTIALMVPAVLVALQGYSVLRLFLIADLLCAATVVPVIAGLWSRVTGRAAVAGSVAGLIGATLPGLVGEGSLVEGVKAATFPGAIPTLGPFLWAVICSGAVTAAVALVENERVDLEAVARRTDALGPV